MTDSEIIAKLQHNLKLGDSPIGKGFGTIIDKQLLADTIALIRSQKAEIAELKELTEKRFNDFATEYDSNLRAEAIKEFENKLYNYIISNKRVNEVMIIEKMTNLKKEMAGADK